MTTRFAAFAGIVILTATLTAAAPAAAQTTRLSLEDALRLAGERSEAVAIARAGEARASADQLRANSQRLPQINLVGAYDRTLASEFSSVLDATPAPCSPLAVDPTKPVADRVTELERAAGCGAIGQSFNFSSLPFGQRNVYRMTVSFAQAVYSGGRIAAQQRQADLGKRTAELSTTSARAGTALDVTRAFYDAALADRLLTIAESGLAQAAAAFDQTKLAFDAGRQPEFELLRAQVARDNQRPAVIRAKAARDVAYLRLRQLLELPATADVHVDVDLDAAQLAPPAPFADALNRVTASSSSLQDHVSLQQAEALVHLREQGILIAKAERLPSVSLASTYGRVGYPSSGAFPGAGDFRTNWTLGASVQVPLFTGHRLKADELAARADLDDATARLKQARELAELDRATAQQDLGAAEAAWQASAGTIQQAQRAYEIAELRFREGLSTQLELSDSRLSLQLAQANRAQAARDLQIARVRLALLPELPVGAR